MPWCPKCGIEYREGFETCSDCGVGLSETPVSVETGSVPESEAETEVESKNEVESESNSDYQFDMEAFLVETGNSIEADMIEGLLNAEEIPVLRKNDDVKIYMDGVSSGVDLYVPSHLLDKAKEILEISKGVLGGEIPEEELEAQALAAEPEDEDPEEEDPENEEEESDDEEAGDGAVAEGIGDEESTIELPVNEESTLNGIGSQETEAVDGELQGQGNKDPETGSFFDRFMHLLKGK
jgi:hypothetical protein